MSYSGFWLRVAALFIDILILIPFSLVFGYIENQPGLFWAGFIGSIVMGWLYFSLFESGTWQATPGKRLMSIKVTNLSGEKIGFGKATARYFAKFLSSLILCIGYLMAAFTQRKQALHDMICETLVLRGKATIQSDTYASNPYGFADPQYDKETLVVSKADSKAQSFSSSGNWVFAGFDNNGQVIRLVFSDSDSKLNSVGIILGRGSSSADLHINDHSISRRHARLYKSDGLLYIEDLGSTNGLYVDGKPLTQNQSAELRPHDSLVIGGIEFSIGRS
jgi:uncharacterized RDD family membrane protein YckC